MDAVRHRLANLGVKLSENTAKVLADASMRFPQHIHGHIKAAYSVYQNRGEVDYSTALAEAFREHP